MSEHRALGFITPSSNIVVERVVQAALAGIHGVSAHFSRIPVYGDGSVGRAAEDYDWDAMLEAARLLGHARLDVICWNGTKGGGYGFDVDHDLCRRIEDETGIAAVTSALATLELLERYDARRIALVTPYADGYQQRMIDAFARKGISCAAERHFGLRDNYAYATVPPEDIAGAAREALRAAPADALVFFCTNLHGAPLAAALETEFDVPVLDSVAVGLWKAMRTAGADPGTVRGWGRIFTD